MAKPILPVPAIFAFDANYTTGPALLIGTATKVPRSALQVAEGWTALETPPAQEYNDLWHQYSSWCKWVAEGSTLAGLTAHIVETDSAGQATIARVDAGGTAYAGGALRARSNSAGAAATFEDTIGNFALTASSTGASAAIRGTSTGISPAIEGLNVGGNGPGLKGTGNGSNYGVIGLGGATGVGVHGTGGGTGGAGVLGLSQTASPGVDGVGGNSAGSPGVLGEAAHIDANGVEGTTAGGTSTANASAIYGDAQGDANGVWGDAADGYGVLAESTGVKRAAFRKVPQTTRGGVYTQSGDEYYDSTTDQHRSIIKGQDMALWATTKGFTCGYAEDSSLQTQTGTTFLTVLTINLSLPYEPRQTGKIRIRVGFESSVPVTGNKFQWRLRDQTASVDALASTQEEHATASALGDTKYVYRNIEYTIPAVGARTFELQIRNSAGGGASYIRRASVEILGVFA